MKQLHIFRHSLNSVTKIYFLRREKSINQTNNSRLQTTIKELVQ